VCFCCVGFCFFIPSQEIVLGNVSEMSRVGCKTLTESINQCRFTWRIAAKQCICVCVCVCVCMCVRVCSEGRDSLPTASTCGSVLMLPHYSRSAVLGCSIIHPFWRPYATLAWLPKPPEISRETPDMAGVCLSECKA